MLVDELVLGCSTTALAFFDIDPRPLQGRLFFNSRLNRLNRQFTYLTKRLHVETPEEREPWSIDAASGHWLPIGFIAIVIEIPINQLDHPGFGG